MKFFKYIALGSLALSLGCGVSSCVNDLDLDPDDPNKKTELSTADEWNAYFMSLYAELVYEAGLTPTGVDGGAGIWTRVHWNLQEITADEAMILNTWNDPGYADLKYNTWVADNTWEYMAYQRQATTAKLCSEFLSQIEGAEVLDGTLKEQMKAEARVLRAYCYYYMIDLYGRGPWITTEAVGVEAPVYDRQQLFSAVTAELEDVIANGALVDSRQQVYGRLSKQAAEMILAKLYLNAEVYTGTAMYDKCAQWCKEIMKDTNTLADNYEYLFCADNDRYVGKGNEIIFAVPQDANHMQSYGGTTYLTAGAYFGDIEDDMKAYLGFGGNSWAGVKMRPELVNTLNEYPGDARNLTYVGQYQNNLQDLLDNGPTGCGIMCIKYKYITSAQIENHNADGYAAADAYCSADYPVFRLADVYLMLSECELRGVAGADSGYELFNKVRARANVAPITNPTLDQLLSERQRELYWEGHRRQDLIRFGKYTGGTYNWSWKGGVYEGRAIDATRSVFAIPYQYVGTVGQNPGY